MQQFEEYDTQVLGHVKLFIRLGQELPNLEEGYVDSGHRTCNAVTGERKKVGVLEPRQRFKHGYSVVVVNGSRVFQHFDCHVDVSWEDSSVDWPTSALR